MATAYPLEISSTYEIAVNGVATDGGATKKVTNLFYYSVPGAFIDNTSAQGLVNEFANVIATLWGLCFPFAYTVASVKCRWMGDPTTAPALYATPTDFNGARGTPGDDFQPTDSSWHIEKIGVGRGRFNQSSWHMSPVLESDTVGFSLTTGFATGAAQNLLVQLILPFTFVGAGSVTYSAVPVLFSPTASQLNPLFPIVVKVTPIKTGVVKTRMGTMVRRKLRAA